LYFSVATVVAETAALAVLSSRGALSQDKLINLLAIAHDVDLASLWRTLEQKTRPSEVEQISLHEILEARALLSTDLDLREMAADKGWNAARQLDSVLEQEKDRYTQLKATFDEELKKLRAGVTDVSVRELQSQLESIDPKQAKDQVLRILDDAKLDRRSAMNVVVAIFKGMAMEKRKKIFSEFKNEDSLRLHEILRQIRLGVPEVTLIRDTRTRLKAFKADREREAARP
jgi:hypothetical protein